MQKLEEIYLDLSPFLQGLLLVIGAILFGLLIRIIVFKLFRLYAKRKPESVARTSIRRRLRRVLSVLFPLLAFSSIIELLNLAPRPAFYVLKITEALLVGTFVWLIVKVLYIIQDVIYYNYDFEHENNLHARKVQTQVQYLRKIAVITVIVIGISVVLLNFDSVRNIGAGLLTSAGVGGIIIGFAAQKSIANLVAGFQIAFTQPIKIDDVVIVEGEWGRIEEITLTYVVVRIWDKRGLIVPINYFIENTFQNWTRVSADIMGTVYLYTDYRIPIEALRAELRRLCEESVYWDKKVCGLVVTDTTEQSVQLRALVSATNSGNAWELRVYVREKMIEFIQKNYPDCLPRTRAELVHTNGQDNDSEPGQIKIKPPSHKNA